MSHTLIFLHMIQHSVTIGSHQRLQTAETQLKAIKRSVHRSQGSHQSPSAWDKHQPGASVITATILRSRAKAHRYLVIQYGKPKSNRRSRAPSLLLLMRLILGLPIPTKSTRRNGG